LEIANPLIDQGLMPTLDDFINHGSWEYRHAAAILSPMLWNSIATGSVRTSMESSLYEPIRKPAASDP